ncbi:MBL fold metallo-hydrolase [Thioalkalivibrio denitrificans]|uniref:MBL fold metallo-hydrolase n=1 Tax=Thioalkalivibrio denitrificans TaxID=108003 RepID=A0A1V3NRN4_9GAMM|nr:MBL fold metallo-hydrolase [Thioalkalivibrio denitrificans]OOG27623.1 MBL fold metallo-hydrolase [Thioalkalivibrio denitrificans]
MLLRTLLPAVVFILLFVAIVSADELDSILEPISVTERVYYFKGSLDGRTYENQAFNNNLAFVLTNDGVVLIDSGPSRKVAERVEQAIGTVTDMPVRWVINSGSQDHRWLGNHYFAERGAEIIALARTAETQSRFAEQHLARLENVLRDRLAGTRAMPAPEPVEADRHAVELGDVRFELIFAGDAHFPGDVLVHIPDEGTVFAGDVVYLDRMLGLHPWSDIRGWLDSFAVLEALEPEHVIPGHGAAADLDKARAETGDYLQAILDGVIEGLDDWEQLNETVDRLADMPRFRHLVHYEEWHRMNVNRAYLDLESNP